MTLPKIAQLLAIGPVDSGNAMKIYEVTAAQLDKPTSTPAQLAKKYKVSIDEVMRQLKKGMKVEREHTSDPAVAKEIALDHLGEKLDYYETLVDEADEFVELDLEQFKKIL